MTTMQGSAARRRPPAAESWRRRAPGLFAALAVAVFTSWVSDVLLSRFGPFGFVIATILAFVLTIYAIISFRELTVPLIVWLVAVGGFKFIWAVRAPLLPDMTLDRITMIWLTIVVMVKFVATWHPLRRFGFLDWLILTHCLYLLVRIIMADMAYFSVWTVSTLIPYAAYFFARNLVYDTRRLKAVLGALFALSVYYNITAVAQKLSLDFLLWPTYMRTPTGEFIGRSGGPFEQAPLFGTIIGMMLPLHLFYFARARSALWKIIVLASFGVGLAGLYFTYTRGSWLAGFAALATAALLNRRRYLPVLTVTLAIGAIAAIAVFGIGQDRFLKERVEQQDTIETRIGVAVTALRAWRSEPLFGVGFFQYRHVYDEFLQPTDVPGYGTVRLRQVRGISLHDIYLGPLAEDGLVGFMLQVGIYFWVFRGLVRRLRRRAQSDEFVESVLPLLAGICVGYLVGGLAFDYRFFSFVGVLFYTAAGIQESHDMELGSLPGDVTTVGAR